MHSCFKMRTNTYLHIYISFHLFQNVFHAFNGNNSQTILEIQYSAVVKDRSQHQHLHQNFNIVSMVTLIFMHRMGTEPLAFLPPATKLGQGHIFTGFCHSVNGGGVLVLGVWSLGGGGAWRRPNHPRRLLLRECILVLPLPLLFSETQTLTLTLS